MRSGKSKIRKFMALVVCAALIGGSLPGVVFAEAGDSTDTADIVKETVSGEGSSVNVERYTTVESSDDVKKETSHKTVETASDAVNPEGEDYIVETLSNAIKPLLRGDDVWQVKSTGKTYTLFKEALEAASDGDTIILLDDKEEIIEIDSDNNIILDLAGHTLDGGQQNGSVITNNGTLTLIDSSDEKSGCITNGNASQGGGVYNSGTFNMDGGTISGNTASSYGGGVYNTGTFNMDDGIIIENTAGEGGGVVNYGIFNMTNGTISGNTAANSNGGGVMLLEGSFNMSGGEISGNTAYRNGDGIYDAIDEFNLSGSPIITDNANTNVYLLGSPQIFLTGALEEGASIGVTTQTTPTESSPVQITYAETDTDYYKESAQYFFYDADHSYVGTANEEGRYVELAKEHVASLTQNGITTEYTSVQAAVNVAGNAAGTVTMLADSTEDVRIESGQTIILDLDGYTLTGLGDASVILNYGALTLEDSSGDDSGKITGGTGSNTNGEKAGGGINNHGDFTMNGGTITGNNAITGGGLFNVSGTSTMNGGMIYKNSAETEGGGIDVIGGTFTLNGGTISDNTAGSNGGGINGPVTIYDGIICNNTANSGGGICSHIDVINLYGGTITGNSATADGGGVYVKIIFNMQGGAIYNNTARNNAADVYSESNSYLAIIDAVTMLGNEDPGQCYKWYNDNSGNRYSPGNIPDVYEDENVINAESPYHIRSNVSLIAAGDEGHIYSEENVTFTWDGTDSCTATFTCTECRHEETVNCDITSETLTEPTCTDKGSAKYTASATITSRGEELTVTDEQTEEIEALGHSYSDEKDNNGSYKYVEFVWNGDEGIDTLHCHATFTCTACEATETVECEITVDPDSIDATCTEAGEADYDATATIESRDGVTVAATDVDRFPHPALGHSWVETDTETTSGDNKEIDVKLTCSRCGETQDETVVIETVGNGVTAHAGYTWSDIIDAATLGDYFFEKDATIDFVVTVDDNNASVSEADKTLTEEKIKSLWPDEEYSVFYLDIGVGMNIYDSTGTLEKNETFDKTINPITFTVTIPDSLKEAAGDTYTVLRIHDGSADELDTTDNGDGTITFASDLFSSYAIVKTDSGTSGGGTSGGGSSSHSDNDDDDNNNTSSTSGSSEGQNVAYVKGTWTIDEYGYWRFTSDTGKKYENEWGYIYNPYADVSAGQPEASWFHFGDDGIMDTGWYTDTDGYIYYLNPELDNTQGRMFTGWNWIKAGDGRNLCYYFDESLASGHYGRLYTSTTTPDGYTVDETGAWTKNGKQVTR